MALLDQSFPSCVGVVAYLEDVRLESMLGVVFVGLAMKSDATTLMLGVSRLIDR